MSSKKRKWEEEEDDEDEEVEVEGSRGEEEGDDSSVPYRERKKIRRLHNLLKRSEEYSRRVEAGPEVTEDDSDEKMKVVNFTATPPFITGGEMRDYQIRGLNWLISVHWIGVHGILADEMGLGKTVQTISLLGCLQAHSPKELGNSIVIVPLSTLGNIEQEFKRWCPSLRTVTLIGSQSARFEILESQVCHLKKWDVLLATYESVIAERGTLAQVNWNYLIIDEGHRIKNETTKLAKLLRRFKSKHRLILTGTPLQNNLHELWALMNFLLPDVFESAGDFDQLFDTERYLQDSQLVSRLQGILGPFVLRRIKADVEKSLPPRKEINVYVTLSNLQREWYKKILMHEIDVINHSTGELKKRRVSNLLMHLRKCCNHPYLFEGAIADYHAVTLADIVSNSGKMIVLDKLLQKLKEEGSRILLFSQMTTMMDILENYCHWKGYKASRLDGQTAREERQKSIDEFNSSDSETFIFMLSTRAGGLGINLSSADVVILYDSDWNPQCDIQAMSRAHRIGQTKEVRVFRLICENTVDERMVKRAAVKLRIERLFMQQKERARDDHMDMLQCIRHGATLILSDEGNEDISDETIETILERSKGKDADFSETMKEDDNVMTFAMNDDWKTFDGIDYRNQMKSLEAIDPVYTLFERKRTLPPPKQKEEKPLPEKRERKVLDYSCVEKNDDIIITPRKTKSSATKFTLTKNVKPNRQTPPRQHLSASSLESIAATINEVATNVVLGRSDTSFESEFSHSYSGQSFDLAVQGPASSNDDIDEYNLHNLLTSSGNAIRPDKNIKTVKYKLSRGSLDDGSKKPRGRPRKQPLEPHTNEFGGLASATLTSHQNKVPKKSKGRPLTSSPPLFSKIVSQRTSNPASINPFLSLANNASSKPGPQSKKKIQSLKHPITSTYGTKQLHNHKIFKKPTGKIKEILDRFNITEIPFVSIKRCKAQAHLNGPTAAHPKCDMKIRKSSKIGDNGKTKSNPTTSNRVPPTPTPKGGVVSDSAGQPSTFLDNDDLFFRIKKGRHRKSKSKPHVEDKCSDKPMSKLSVNRESEKDTRDGSQDIHQKGRKMIGPKSKMKDGRNSQEVLMPSQPKDNARKMIGPKSKMESRKNSEVVHSQPKVRKLIGPKSKIEARKVQELSLSSPTKSDVLPSPPAVKQEGSPVQASLSMELSHSLKPSARTPDSKPKHVGTPEQLKNQEKDRPESQNNKDSCDKEKLPLVKKPSVVMPNFSQISRLLKGLQGLQPPVK